MTNSNAHYFKVGDLAILQHATHFHEYENWIVEIVSHLTTHRTVDLRTMERYSQFGYSVRLISASAKNLPGAGVWCCSPHQLRPIVRPDEDLDTEQAVVASKGEIREVSEETAESVA